MDHNGPHEGFNSGPAQMHFSKAGCQMQAHLPLFLHSRAGVKQELLHSESAGSGMRSVHFLEAFLG